MAHFLRSVDVCFAANTSLRIDPRESQLWAEISISSHDAYFANVRCLLICDTSKQFAKICLTINKARR